MNTQSKLHLPRTTQAAEGLMRRAWTVAQTEEMVRQGFIGESERFELIGGEIVPMSPKGRRHEHYKISLMEFWTKRKSNRYRIAQETTFRLDEFSFVEPDFLFYDSSVQAPQLAPSNTLLAVEISDSTLSYDKGRKARIYANFGIKTLWVIDVATLNTHVFEQPGIDGYQITRIVSASQALSPTFAPELNLTLSELELI